MLFTLFSCFDCLNHNPQVKRQKVWRNCCNISIKVMQKIQLLQHLQSKRCQSKTVSFLALSVNEWFNLKKFYQTHALEAPRLNSLRTWGKHLLLQMNVYIFILRRFRKMNQYKKSNPKKSLKSSLATL